MSKVCISTNVMAPADAIWQLVGSFNEIGKWHPLAKDRPTEGSGKGATRKIALPGGGAVVERLDYVSDRERVYVYSITDSPLPIANCVAEVHVIDNGDGTSKVEWSNQFTAAGAAESEAVKTLRSVYETGLENLTKLFPGQVKR